MYLNSISDLGEIKEEIEHTIININIPIEVEYEIINNLLSASAGISFNSPIFSEISEETIQQKSNRTKNTYYIEYSKETIINNTGAKFKDLVFNFIGHVNYHIAKNVSIELGYSQNLNNIFNKPKSLYSFSTPQSEYLKQSKITIGFRYNFKNNVAPESALN